MKKQFLLLVAAACLCPKIANAQEEEQRKFSIMPYVGVNYSSLSGYKFHESRNGSVKPTFGLQLQYNLSDKAALLFDYNYRQMGYKRSFEGFQTTFPGFDKDLQAKANSFIVKSAFDYHTFGFQFKYNLFKGLSARAGIEAMFQSSYSGKLEGDVFYPTSYGYGFGYSSGYGHGYSAGSWHYFGNDGSMFAIPLGLTYEHKNITVNATYHLPLTSQGEYCHLGDGKDRTWNTRLQTIDLTVGYRIPFGKKRK